jgi:GAF domain-containing protein
VSDDALNESLAALSKFFVGDNTMEATLDRVAHMAARAVPPAAMAGITMMERNRPGTSVFTDPEVPHIDQRQYETGFGPCLDSFRTGAVIAVVSTKTDTRWPPFTEACLDHGVMSTLSLPLTCEDVTHGALNFYAREEAAFSPEHLGSASAFAVHAAIVLANARAYWNAHEKAEQLQQAITTRAVIEQAKGIVMSSMRCSPDDAFKVLVTQSQQQNRKLRDVAEEVVRLATRRH